MIAVANGLAISYWKTGHLDPLYAAVTFAGVICLHASVDLLNDYWDFKRGIDQETKRTKFSGGTGVLPERLLTPKAVYAAGIMFLVAGVLIGAYFVLLRGPAIAAILGFAVVAIYFYSSSIVNAGLGELFVGIKGSLIVIGTCYVQLGYIEASAVYAGSIIGLLSATVLLVNSFPDMSADRAKGRRTLVILLGKKNATKLFSILFLTTYSLIAVGSSTGIMKVYCMIAIASFPLAIRAIKFLKTGAADVDATIVPAMSATITYSRLTGALLVIGYLL